MLQELWLSKTRLTNAGLEQIAQLTSLRKLILPMVLDADQAAVTAGSLPYLEYYSGPLEIGDKGLEAISQASNLEGILFVRPPAHVCRLEFSEKASSLAVLARLGF